jgi:fibronectin-binding autotransporter adhesin
MHRRLLFALAASLFLLALSRAKAADLSLNGSTYSFSTGALNITSMYINGGGYFYLGGTGVVTAGNSFFVGEQSLGTMVINSGLATGYGAQISNGGSMYVNGGTFRTTGETYVGYNTSGTMFVNGGVVRAGSLNLGQRFFSTGSPARGIVVQTAGSVESAGALTIAYDWNAVAAYSLEGGQLSASTVQLGRVAGFRWAELSITSGTLTTGAISAQLGSGVSAMLTLAGGRINATGSNENFIGSNIFIQKVSDAATTFNTNGHAIGIQSNITRWEGLTTPDGGITVIGGGTLTLSATNSFYGQTRVQEGSTLRLAGSKSLMNSTLNLTSGNVQFLNHTSSTLGGLAGTQGISLVNNLGAAVALDVAGNHENTTYSGALSGSGSLVKSGTGALTLTGINTHSGGTQVTSGTLVLAGAPANGIGIIRGDLSISNATVVAESANAFGYENGAKVNAVTINSGTLISNAASDQGWGVTYTLNNALMSSNGGVSSGTASSKFAFGGHLTAKTSVTAQTGTSTIAGHVVLRGDGANASGTDFTVADGATLLVSAAITSSNGSTGFTKLGAGTMILTGSNTYTAGTQITAGTLLVNNSNGSGTGTGAVVVSGGRLGGSGIISGTVRVQNSGTLAAGNSIGTLTVGTLAMEDVAAFAVEIDTTTGLSDLVVVNGSLFLDLDNTVVLQLADLGGDQPLSFGTTFTLIDYSGIWNGGTFAGLADDSTFEHGANTYRISYDGADNATSAVTLTAVPEPASTALLFGAATSLLALHRRKRA